MTYSTMTSPWSDLQSRVRRAACQRPFPLAAPAVPAAPRNTKAPDQPSIGGLPSSSFLRYLPSCLRRRYPLSLVLLSCHPPCCPGLLLSRRLLCTPSLPVRLHPRARRLAGRRAHSHPLWCFVSPPPSGHLPYSSTRSSGPQQRLNPSNLPVHLTPFLLQSPQSTPQCTLNRSVRHSRSSVPYFLDNVIPSPMSSLQ
jgi:hypothetical protein